MTFESLKRSPLSLAALALLLSSPLVAEEYVLTLDSEKTTAHFLLGATGHDVEGRLFLSSGELRLDTATGLASGQVVLDALQTETGNKRRDKKMHNEVLLSEQHPMITFEAQSWSGDLAMQGASDLEIVGTMTLVGQSHAISLPIHIDVQNGALEGKSSFTVPFIDWGLRDPSILFLSVDKDVQVTVEAVGQLLSAAASPAASPAASAEPSPGKSPSGDVSSGR